MVDRTIDRRWQKDGHDILRCPSCGVLFRADLPGSEELAEIYGPSYFSEAAGDTGGQGYADYVGEELNHRANARARLNLLERHGALGRLLDVGCAAGFFLDEARRRGWEVQGVELSPGIVEYARRRLDLEVRTQPFSECGLEPESFDAITMWDYIEHSNDPRGDLRRAATLIRPGGLLAVSTGDAGSIAARAFGRRWHLLTPRHHNFFFTRASLERAFREAGFDIVAVSHMSGRYSVKYVLYKLRTFRDWGVLRRMSGRLDRMRLGQWAIPINLYDIVTVLGRRSS